MRRGDDFGMVAQLDFLRDALRASADWVDVIQIRLET